MNKFDFGKPLDVWQGEGALPVWFFPWKAIDGAIEIPVGDNAYHWCSTQDAIEAQQRCPECGENVNEEVCPFSECHTCEKRIAEENRRAARPFDTSPASPLALRLAESMKDDRRCDG